jgi:hypothetical protein
MFTFSKASKEAQVALGQPTVEKALHVNLQAAPVQSSSRLNVADKKKLINALTEEVVVDVAEVAAEQATDHSLGLQEFVSGIVEGRNGLPIEVAQAAQNSSRVDFVDLGTAKASGLSSGAIAAGVGAGGLALAGGGGGGGGSSTSISTPDDPGNSDGKGKDPSQKPQKDINGTEPGNGKNGSPGDNSNRGGNENRGGGNPNSEEKSNNGLALGKDKEGMDQSDQGNGLRLGQDNDRALENSNAGGNGNGGQGSSNSNAGGNSAEAQSGNGPAHSNAGGNGNGNAFGLSASLFVEQQSGNSLPLVDLFDNPGRGKGLENNPHFTIA